jgi:SAM-dependent methyltransferase
MNIRKLTRSMSHLANLTRSLECRLLCDWLEINGQDQVCDIGCGDSFWSQQVARRARAVFSVDYTAAACQEARTLFGDSAKVTQASAEQLPFQAQVFDKVVSFSVWMLLEDDRKALREVHRVLKPGGKLGISVDSLSLASISADFKTIQTQRYGLKRFYTHGDLDRLLADTGFRMTRFRYIGVTRLSSWLIAEQVRLGWNVNYLVPFTIPIFNLSEWGRCQGARSGHYLAVAAEKLT